MKSGKWCNRRRFVFVAIFFFFSIVLLFIIFIIITDESDFCAVCSCKLNEWSRRPQVIKCEVIGCRAIIHRHCMVPFIDQYEYVRMVREKEKFGYSCEKHVHHRYKALVREAERKRLRLKQHWCQWLKQWRKSQSLNVEEEGDLKNQVPYCVLLLWGEKSNNQAFIFKPRSQQHHLQHWQPQLVLLGHHQHHSGRQMKRLFMKSSMQCNRRSWIHFLCPLSQTNRCQSHRKCRKVRKEVDN